MAVSTPDNNNDEGRAGDSGTSAPTRSQDRHAPHFICWGEVLWDLFPDGRLLGGAPANVACHLATLGERVSLVTRVGDDTLGREARATLRTRGVDVATVQLDSRRPTGRVEVELTDGEPSYRLIPDCAWEHIELTESAERALASASSFCFGTLSQRRSTSAFRQALAMLPATCLRVCDVNVRPSHVDHAVLELALEAAQVVKLNQQEADILAQRAGVGDLPGWLASTMGVEVVALTRGEAGCVLFRNGERVEHRGHAAAAGGDNVGAGDAFTAVLARMLVGRRPLADIADRGNRYGAFVASQRGATPEPPAALIEALRR